MNAAAPLLAAGDSGDHLVILPLLSGSAGTPASSAPSPTTLLNLLHRVPGRLGEDLQADVSQPFLISFYLF
jgi:hypothetical protein